MRKSVLLHLIVIAVLYPVLINSQQSDEWITTIEELDQNVTFYCNSSLQTGSPYNESQPERWMLPDLENIPLDYNDGHIIVSEGGWRLDIIEATADDFGVYHCMMITDGGNGEWYLVKLGLNIRGPYFEDLWEKYEMNTIIGLSAMFGFLAVAGAIILVYTFRYIPEEEEEEAKPYEQPSSPIDAYGVKSTPSSNEYQQFEKNGTVGGEAYDNLAYDNEITPSPTVTHRTFSEDDTYL